MIAKHMAINTQMVWEPQANQNTVVANQRVSVLKSVDDLKSIGGKDDYVASLRAIVKEYPDGILLAKIQTVLTDAKALTAARDALKGEIDEVTKGKSILMKPKVVAE